MSREVLAIIYTCCVSPERPDTTARDVVGPGLSFVPRRFPKLQPLKKPLLLEFPVAKVAQRSVTHMQ
jgi:hypothetical protein